MLPPIPQGLVPVTVQQDPVKPRSDIQPVMPPQESESNSQIQLADKQERDEHGRRKKREPEENHEEEELEELQVPGKKAMSRKGVLVNIRV